MMMLNLHGKLEALKQKLRSSPVIIGLIIMVLVIVLLFIR